MLRPGQMPPLPPWLRHCLEVRFISLLRVMHAAKYTEVEPSYKNSHTDINSKQKPQLYMQRNVEPSATVFQAFNSVIRSFTGSSGQCFEAPTAWSLPLMLSFYRTNVEPIDQVKSNLSWFFSKTASLPQANNPKSAQNSEKSSCYQRVLTEELLITFSFGHHSSQSSE